MNFLNSSQDDDNEEIFAPPNATSKRQQQNGGAGLGSLFAHGNAASSASLQYQPPKPPGEEDPREVKQQNPVAFVVDAHLYDNSSGQYKSVGKVGMTSISKNRGQELIVLYRNSQQKLALAAVDDKFRFDVQGRNSPNSYQNFIRILLPMSTTCLFST
jgi:hypothetical protein